ncbi:MAG TPA: UDP-glucose 4-epimerase GalE [Rhodospirillaceae bacterium]|nr:UDP-glucose 4-epimerase GalE [Rhodospirillaceae bacterium]
MKILVTGGAGYIGSHTCMALKKAGHEPIVLDSLVKGHAWAVKYGPFVKADIADEQAVRRVCEQYKPEALIHFAAFIEVGESVAEPEKYMENNFHKAKRLFDTVCDCGVSRVVFSSTAAVYGVPETEGPIAEEHPLVPINPYGEAKLLTENYLRELETKGLHSVALRYFNAAGAAPIEEEIGEAHSPETHLVPNVILAGLGLKDEVRLFGSDYPTRDGTAVRDYIHVLDLADAHVKALDYLMKDGASTALNLGTGNGATVLEVLEAVQRALGSSVPHSSYPRRAGDPPFLLADATRAHEVLGWSPRHTLDDIVTSALAWHRHIL